MERKSLKVCVIGLGSIGTRHSLNLLRREVEVMILRSGHGSRKLDKNLDHVIVFNTVSDALNANPDGVIVCSPTALHVEHALPFVKKGIPVLIEKPLAYDFQETEALSLYHSLVRVAYCLRFNSLYRNIKRIIDEGLIGHIWRMDFKRSFFLPFWHPCSDYTLEYAARRDLGGGVVRTLSHEIDLMIHWFGMPLVVDGLTDKLSSLEIDTDDFAYFSCKLRSGCRVNFELDFFSPSNQNNGEACGTKGKLTWIYGKGIWLENYSCESKLIYEDSPTSNDLMYGGQLDDFLGFVKEGKSISATLQDSQNVLRIVEQIKNYVSG